MSRARRVIDSMRQPTLTSAVCLSLLTTALAAAAPAEAPATATLSPAVQGFLATSAAGATLDVILTFDDAAGVARMETLGVAHDKAEAFPMANARLTSAQLRTVAAWAEVRSVWENAEQELHLDEGTRMVNADDVWDGDGLRMPYTGLGVGVAIVDTGIDTTHPDLPMGAKVKHNFYVGGNPLGPQPGTLAFVESPQTDTEHGHGTHVAGTVAGSGAASNGQYAGVAPGAHLVGFKVGAGASVLTWWALRAWDWVYVHHEEPAYNLRVVSNSWGGGGGSDYAPDDPVNVAAKLLYDEDVIVVFSAGNSGGPDKLGRNAVSPYVVSVGAVNKDFTKASFSSVGRPGGDMTRDENGLYRPTVMAPGVDIVAPRSSAGAVMTQGVQADNPFYTSASGTSMSAPHVSGIAALMLQARPQLSAQDVIDILEGTARDMPHYEAWEVGAGMVDALAAVKAAERGQTSFPPSTSGKTPAYVLREGSAFSGTVAPAGYALKAASDATIFKLPIEVGDGVEALYGEVGWARNVENLYLYLYDPSGKEVASSAGLLDVGSVNFRTAVVTNPVPGTWTLTVEGRVNTLTDFTGYWGAYDENVPKKQRQGAALTSSTVSFDGVSGPGADPASDHDYHTIEVPAGVQSVSVRIDWANPTMDLDLYVYDSTGREVGRSTAGGTDFEETTVVTGDPMGAGLEAGTWSVEVRGWLAVSEPYAGSATVVVAGS